MTPREAAEHVVEVMRRESGRDCYATEEQMQKLTNKLADMWRAGCSMDDSTLVDLARGYCAQFLRYGGREAVELLDTIAEQEAPTC